MPLRAAVQDCGRRRSTSITWAIAATRFGTAPRIRLRYGRHITSSARQPSDVGSIGLSALRTPGGLVGTTAPGWNSGMPGSQSSRAACSSASTLAEESSRLALPIQPQVQRAWFLRRSRTTTTTPRPPVESPIVARSPPSVVSCSPGCSAEPWPPPTLLSSFRKRQLHSACLCPPDGMTRTSLVDTHLLDGEQTDYPRISPEVGTPVPAVTSTCSTFGT